MKLRLVIISSVYLAFCLLVFIVGFCSDLEFSSTIAANIFTLCQLPLLAVPVIWISVIRKRVLRVIGFWLYGVFVVFASPIIVILAMWFTNSLIVGNGFRSVYEIPLDDGRRIVIFRTPDIGAFGGDELIAEVVEAGFLCFENRKGIRKGVYFDDFSGLGLVEFEDVVYEIPHYDDLRECGGLQID